MTEDILKKLLSVQIALKAPKDKRNTFAKFNYRSCEGILEAAKPHLKEVGLTITMRDDIIEAGGRIYVHAVVYANGEKIGCAFAREEETKKGMDAAQITGSASSYARKYALNGVFLIDDSEDFDSMNNAKEEAPKAPPAKAATPPAAKPAAKPVANRNQDVTDWKLWKTPKGMTLGEIVSSEKIGQDKKIQGIEQLKSILEKAITDTKDDNEAHGYQSDLVFVNAALSEVSDVPF